MILVAALILFAGFVAIAPANAPRATRWSAAAWRWVRLQPALGWALVATSLPIAMAGGGWFGLLAWIGLVPVAAGAILISHAYRLRPAVAAAGAGILVLAIGWLGGLG